MQAQPKAVRLDVVELTADPEGGKKMENIA